MGVKISAIFDSALAIMRRAVLDAEVIKPKMTSLCASVAGLMVLGILTSVQPANSAEETASLPEVTTLRPDLNDHARLPGILSVSDQHLYRQLFALHLDGNWRKADRLIKKLDNDLLVGNLMAMRYLHPTKYRSRYKELKDWMGKYADHPDASRIYRLAMKRRPANYRAPKRPVKGYLNGVGEQMRDPLTEQVLKGRSAAARKVLRGIRRYVARGYPTGALKLLSQPNSRKVLSAKEFAWARAMVGHGYYVFGKDDLALKYASRTAREMGEAVPVSHWISGLAAWRLGKIEEAGQHFEAYASANVSPESMAAGAYWASRANLRTRKPRRATKWLARAAMENDTFYGLLAREALGISIPFDWSLPVLTDNGISEILSHAGGKRAVALLEIGRSDLADRELRKLYPQLPEYLHAQLMTIAARYGMASLSIRLAGKMKTKMGHTWLAALFPVPDLEPDGGYTTDRALIYGIIRKESGFNARAKSRAGARGLMQIMPSTAAYITKDRDLKRRGKYRLLDPGINLRLGQDYVEYLMAMERIDGDLFALLAAYNAGPGNLGKWRRKIEYDNDPLLFIESLPARETRAYVEATLRNVWMYRYRLNGQAPSLGEVAVGEWPTYATLDNGIPETGVGVASRSGPISRDRSYARN